MEAYNFYFVQVQNYVWLMHVNELNDFLIGW